MAHASPLGKRCADDFRRFLGGKCLPFAAHAHHKDAVVRLHGEKRLDIIKIARAALCAAADERVQHGFLHGEPVLVDLALQRAVLRHGMGKHAVQLFDIPLLRLGLLHKFLRELAQGHICTPHGQEHKQHCHGAQPDQRIERALQHRIELRQHARAGNPRHNREWVAHSKAQRNAFIRVLHCVRLLAFRHNPTLPIQESHVGHIV